MGLDGVVTVRWELSMPHSGESAALLSALVWALAAVIFSHLSQSIPAMGLNFAKAFVALLMVLFTLGSFGQLTPESIVQTWQLLLAGQYILPLPLFSLFCLLSSGVLGIAIGDTFYLRALACLGARRTLLLATLSPPLAALMAFLWLQETFSPSAGLGVFLTMAGVFWVISERTSAKVEPLPQVQQGVIWALLFSLAQASGALLSRAAFVRAAAAGQPVDPLWAAGLRLGTGCGVLVIWGLSRQNFGKWLKGFQQPRRLGLLILAAFMGTFLGIWLQQLSLKHTSAGIAQTLSSTSPLFVLPLAIGLGEKVSPRAFLGVVIALGGIALLFLVA
jgi:drug/metabolite transporter (DMT)-like permease